MERPRLLIPLPLSNLTPEGINSKSYHKLQREGFQPLIATVSMGKSELQKLYEQTDGVVFPGGPDINPILYGERVHPMTQNVNAEQDAFELDLVKRVLDDGKPTLGICRGAQLLTVARGGVLEQHIPDITNEQHGVSIDVVGRSSYHDIFVYPNTTAHNIFGVDTMTQVLSRHHQAIQDVGELKVSGKSPAGIVELVEDPDLPFYVGVQPHLELIPPMESNYQHTSALFGSFREAVLFHAESLNRREAYAV